MKTTNKRHSQYKMKASQSIGLHVEGGKQSQITNTKKRINEKLKLSSDMIFKQLQILRALENLIYT